MVSARGDIRRPVIPALAALLPKMKARSFAFTNVVYPDVVDPQKSLPSNEIDILVLAYEGLTRIDTNQETVPGCG